TRRALGVAPTRNDLAARLSHSPPDLAISEDRLQRACESFDVPSRESLSIHARPNQIGCAAYLRGGNDRKARTHCLVHGQTPRLVFRRQNEHIRCVVDLGQGALVYEPVEMHIIESESIC